MIIETYLEFLPRYWALLKSLHLQTLVVLAVIAAIYILVMITMKILARRWNVPRGLIRSVKWLFILSLVYATDYLVLSALGTTLVDVPVLCVKTFAWWFFLKYFLDGVWADLWMKRIKKRRVSHYFVDLFKFVIVIILVVSGLKSIFDIQVSSLLTSSAIVTAIIGFSMRDTISSFVSGLLIQFEKPFVLGEWITVGDLSGMVTETSWRYTKIQTMDRNYVFIPNNVISKERLVNYNRPIPQVRREIAVPAPLDTPPVKVRAALLAAIRDSRYVVARPRPKVRADAILEDRIMYALVFYLRRYEDIRPSRDEITAGVWYQFKKRGIDLPYPARELRRPRRTDTARRREAMDILQGLPLFAGLPEDDLRLLLESSGQPRFARGGHVVRRGGRDTSLFIILEGEVEVRLKGEVLATLSRGDFFGEMALLTGEPRGADVAATSPVHCLEIDREGFRMLLEKNTEVMDNVNAVFNQRSASAPRAGTRSRHHDHQSLLSRFRNIFS